MCAADLVLAYLDMFIDSQPSDDQIEKSLVHRGYERTMVRQAIQLIPLAFGRRILEGLVDPHPEYVLLSDEGSVLVRARLVGHPIYVSAVAISAQRVDLIQTVGLRSSEIHAVNTALNAGSDPRDLAISPPVLFDSAPTVTGLENARRIMLGDLPSPERKPS